ncbi:hypothetical protein D9M68_635090 [compost metagenome]
MMRQPTRPQPTTTTWPSRYLRSVLIGSTANGSSRCSSLRANAERRSAQSLSGLTRPNTAGFKAMEINAPASTRLTPSCGIRPRLKPRPARMKENSPICARLAATVSAVFSG